MISVGANNRYGHPDNEVISNCDKLNIDLLMTKDVGMIHIFTFKRDCVFSHTNRIIWYTRIMNYILHGHDEGRVKQKINALKTKHHIENVIVFDATDDEQQDVFNEMDYHFHFDDDKMIVIENATFLPAKIPLNMISKV